METSVKIVGSVTPGKSPKISGSKTPQGSKFGENVNPNLTKSGKSSNSKISSSFMSPRNLDRSAKIEGSVCVTPGKSSEFSRSKTPEGSNFGENGNPNLSPAVRSGKSGKSASKNLKNSSLLVSPRNLMRERRFVVANKKWRKVCGKCKEKGVKKCICVAYERLRASQETFFEKQCEAVDYQIETSEHHQQLDGNRDINPRNGVENEVDGYKNENPKNEVDGEEEEESGLSSATFKRNRDKLLEEARESVPEPGSGRVMHLVKAFEKLLSMRKNSNSEAGGFGDGDEKESEDGNGADFYKQIMSSNRKVVNWALPGMQLPKECESHESRSSFCPSNLFLTSEKLGLLSGSSMDSIFGSVSSGAAGGGRSSRRNSTESCGSSGGSRWKKKQLRVTDQKPFKLRTEQRGRMKEEELRSKIRKMVEEQERMRIPIAQGLPRTTDEPELLVKPPVKEMTRAIDLKLHSDVRAVERAEFDQQVAEKMSLLEQYRMECERQLRLAEEEEVRRLRKELVPKAQPMPYFDRPFVPRRAEKHPTIPKEPKFHIPEHKRLRSTSLTTFHQ